jgi:glycine/D-amino acid oxidase-like deaminating enzyme
MTDERPLAADAATRRRLAVIGGGVMGMATAVAAARLGGERVQVDVYEQHAVGWEGGASIDATRAIRASYGGQEHYSRWVAEVTPMWAALEEEAGRTLFVRSGFAWLSHDPDRVLPVDPEGGAQNAAWSSGRDYLEQGVRVLRGLGLRADLLDAADVRERFPQMADAGVQLALHEPDAGVLYARESVFALRDVALRRGVRIHDGAKLVEVAPTAGGCGLRFADGSSVEADAAVLATNAWTNGLLPGFDRRMPGGPLQCGELPVILIAPRPEEAAAFAPERLPFFVFNDRMFYGSPLTNGAVKLGIGDPWRTIANPEAREPARPEYRAQILEAAMQMLPGLRGATLVQEKTCF